uniref:Uncharacterized protein n=1 Tax=Globodera rostochiensis TaxID=31243 RepID=A0A914H325_GLORO
MLWDLVGPFCTGTRPARRDWPDATGPKTRMARRDDASGQTRSARFGPKRQSGNEGRQKRISYITLQKKALEFDIESIAFKLRNLRPVRD